MAGPGPDWPALPELGRAQTRLEWRNISGRLPANNQRCGFVLHKKPITVFLYAMKKMLMMGLFVFAALNCVRGQSVVINGDFSQGLTNWAVVELPSNQVLTGTLAQIQFSGRTNLSEAFTCQPGINHQINLQQLISLSAGVQYQFYADIAATAFTLNNGDLGTFSLSIGGTNIASVWLGSGNSAYGTLTGTYGPTQGGEELLVINFSRGYGPYPIDYIGNISLMPLPFTATAVGTLSNSFFEAANVTYGGYGYTNTPLVRIIGGGGSGAQAFATVSNGVVTSITVNNAGIGYTNAPLVVIEPPFILNPVLAIAPMSFLTFSNLTVGGTYQMQHSLAWYWTNLPISFTATNLIYTQMVAGVIGTGDFRLALNPVPSQAFASPEVSYGFVVHATVTSGGSGYITSPAVSIVGGGGTNATAVSHISGGVVTSISITSAGIGYTNTPTIQIAPPPAAAVSPSVSPVMRVDSASLAPFDNYQIQFKPNISGTWENWNGGFFSPTDVKNSQYVFITNAVGFFRLQYVP